MECGIRNGEFGMRKTNAECGIGNEKNEGGVRPPATARHERAGNAELGMRKTKAESGR
jgi:hypothetical protein